MPNIDPVRVAALDAAVARWAKNNWTVSSVSGATAVLQRKKRIGWFWNLVLTLLTGGVWLIVVIIRVVNRKIETIVLTVDEYARVHTS